MATVLKKSDSLFCRGHHSSSAKSGASEALTLSVLEFLTGLKLCNFVVFHFKQSLVNKQST